ncbi:hypothetical protein Hanom_Chr17g01531581 [Helianthus anomalus]
MAVAELTPAYTTTDVSKSKLSYVSSSSRLSYHRRLSFQHLSRPTVRCSVTSK